MTSAVLILPAAYRDAGNAFGVQQGWGEGNFSVALSADGSAPATHWGCRADVGQSFVDMVTNSDDPLVLVLISSLEDNMDPYDHWLTTLAARGLTVVI